MCDSNGEGWSKRPLKAYGIDLGAFDAGTLTYIVFRELLSLVCDPRFVVVSTYVI